MDVARRNVEAMLAIDAASSGVGIELLDVGPGHARCRMTVGPQMVNGHAICHGGYVFLFADTTFACACNTYGPVTVASGAEITFVAPVREGDVLVAEASERVRFGRNGIYDITVRKQDGEIVAEFRGQSRALRDGGGGTG